MRRKDFNPSVIAKYTNRSRHFLQHISRNGIALEAVRPDHVKAYLRARRQQYRRCHGHAPVNHPDWRSGYTAPLHMLLRLAQGTWPPESSRESCVQALKESLQREQLGVGTVEQYLQHARQFLAHLDRQQIPLERASQQDLDSFIAERLRIYGKKHGRLPGRLVRWRCAYTPAIHRLLREARGQWPPPSAGDADLRRFELQLIGRGLSHKHVQACLKHAREFLDYLTQRGISVAEARTADVDTYFGVALWVQRKQNPNLPTKSRYWRIISQRAVCGFLQFVQGEWPPGSTPGPELAKFRAHLEKCRYGRTVIPNYVSAARQFLRYLKGQSIIT